MAFRDPLEIVLRAPEVPRRFGMVRGDGSELRKRNNIAMPKLQQQADKMVCQVQRVCALVADDRRFDFSQHAVTQEDSALSQTGCDAKSTLKPLDVDLHGILTHPAQ
jgi:hypothetical protein